jgi:hypothetical protein
MSKFYDEGWNDYVDGIIPDFTGNHPYTKDYKDGWMDCVEATEKYGKQKKI